MTIPQQRNPQRRNTLLIGLFLVLIFLVSGYVVDSLAWQTGLLFLEIVFIVTGMILVWKHHAQCIDISQNILKQALKDEQEVIYSVEVSRERSERANRLLSAREEKMCSQLEELEKLQKLTIDRELKMIELKDELEKCGRHHVERKKVDIIET